jgi:hypothetical protein
VLSQRVQPLNAVICHSFAGAFRAMPRSAGPSPGCFVTIAGPAMGEVALGYPTAGDPLFQGAPVSTGMLGEWTGAVAAGEPRSALAGRRIRAGGAHMGCRHECHERAGPGGA